MTETTHARIDLHDVQGNLIGFNKSHQRLVFFAFADVASGKAFLGQVAGQVATGSEVRSFNALFKEVAGRSGGAEGIVTASWLNLTLSASGLQLLGAPGMESFPADFTAGMKAQAAQLGDVGKSDPSGWLAPFDNPRAVHGVVILAADQPDHLEARYRQLQQLMSGHQVSELGHQDGDARPGDQRGREHFGFKDGISQPGIHGLTTSSKAGQDVIAAGEFLIGYPDQSGHISGTPEEGPPPQPGQPGYPLPPTPASSSPMPDWAHNGSFLVYRRLRQDVPAFRVFLESEGQQLGLDPGLVGAKLVGRWASGAPVEHVPGLPASVDPAASDPSLPHPQVLDDHKINNFDYQPHDAGGQAVPHAAHIRKANPRSSNPNGGRAGSNLHRILRRGIAYGPEVEPGEAPYGESPVPDERDRGLLFLCYQASIARGFAFIQQQWANAADFPSPGDGQDPIISQNIEPRDFNLPQPSGPAHLAINQWVFTTGGEYFFSPSISGLRALSQ